MKAAAFWYAVGALIVIVGLTVSVIGVLRDFKSLQTTFIRFVVPGSSALRLGAPGPYVIYYEHRSVVNGETFDTPDLTDIKCSVTSRDGRELEVAPFALTAEYDFGGHAGKAVAQFAVSAAGTYIISCQHPGGKRDRIVLAVAPPLAIDFGASLLRWLALAFGSIGLGLVVLIVTLVRRAVPTRPAPPLA